MIALPKSTAPRRAMTGLVAILLAVLLAACYPGGPEETSDLGAVVTARVPGADYTGLATFALEDTVIVLKLDDSSAEPIDPSYNPVILAELRAQMVAAGFQDVTPDTATVTPDVWLVVGAVQAEVWFYWYNWGYYGGWWGPGWGYYPPSGGTGSFQNGTVLWQLLDLRDVDPGAPDQEPAPIWMGGLNGVVSGSHGTNESGIRKGIDQAFYQSPYIKGTPAKQQEDAS